MMAELEVGVFKNQRARVARRLTQNQQRLRLDPGGGYDLTIRGHKPAQIALAEVPAELRKRDGETGYRMSEWSFVNGH